MAERERGTASKKGGGKKEKKNSGGTKGQGHWVDNGVKFGEHLFSPPNHGLLNPPFDPRMRKVGSPLNQSSKIKRGWIQAKDSTSRVNFLFNPSELGLGATVDPNTVPSPDMAPDSDATVQAYIVGSPATLNFALLYDRTYELFSPPKKANGEVNMAAAYGVYADVAAWYTYLGMHDKMPRSWLESLPTAPPLMVMSYLFIGPHMLYHGMVNSINVTYTHWTQNMVPQRCKIDISFNTIPVQKGEGPKVYGPGLNGFGDHTAGWVSDWSSSGSAPVS